MRRGTILLLALTGFAVGLLAWRGTHRPAAPAPNTPGVAPGTELRVAAAADLQKAFTELATLFEKETGAKVTLVFGATGTLVKQVENGAPFDLLAAADEKYLSDLETKGKIVYGTHTLYAEGHLVVWTRKGDPAPKSLHELGAAIYKRIAIADPEHAPYGRAARAALESAGVWEAVQPKIIYGDNVRQTLQYAESGNADAALVSQSLTLETDGQTWLVPDDLHPPLRQAMGLVAGTTHPELARQFVTFVVRGAGRDVMRRYGFTLPE
jgi:molybdate transport system substrate-binding protein